MKNLIVRIDTPKYSFVKYKDNGKIDYPSPIPFTVNYGNILDTVAEDGDKVDLIVIGKRIPRGKIAEVSQVGTIEFLDNGQIDNKIMCCFNQPSNLNKINVLVFFNLFAVAKKMINVLRGKFGATKLVKIKWAGGD